MNTDIHKLCVDVFVVHHKNICHLKVITEFLSIVKCF